MNQKINNARSTSRRLRSPAVLLVLGLMGVAGASAANLTVFYPDPIGDSTGSVDVTSMVLAFDNVTGSYTITFTATAAQPFAGAFRINVNLFDPTPAPGGFFQDTGNDFNLTASQTTLILTGTSAALTNWNVGDQVAANTQAGLGNPMGSTLFRTSVDSFPLTFLTNEDTIAYGPGQGIAIVTAATAQDTVVGLLSEIQVLLGNGTLDNGQANSLSAKLSSALSSLNRGNDNSVCGQLGAFINQVNALQTSGALPAVQAQALIQAAQAASALAGC